MKLSDLSHIKLDIIVKLTATFPTFMKCKTDGDYKDNSPSETSLVEDCCHVESLSPIQGKLIGNKTPMISTEPSDLFHIKLGHPSA